MSRKKANEGWKHKLKEGSIIEQKKENNKKRNDRGLDKARMK